MNTHLRAWSLGVLEASSLLALVAVPLLVDFYAFRVFDLGKSAVLVGLAVVALLALLVAAIEARASWRAALGPLPLAALALWATTAVATATSVVPFTSLVGSSERAHGLVFVTGVLVLFAAVGVAALDPARRARMLAVAVAGSVPVGAFALAQAAGIAVVPGTVESTARVFGTLGNPIFLGAYLMLLAPVALSRAAEAARGGRMPTAAAWAAVLVLQLAALLATASRGPLLGLAAGAVVLALAWSARGGRRVPAYVAIGALVLGLGTLGLLNLPSRPLASVAGWPVVGRFAEIGATDTGSQAARLRIWSAVGRLVAAEPARLATGHGPEALKYALLPYAGPNIAGRGQADRLADRAHNVLLDALVTTGVPGALALLLVFGAWLHAAASAAGLAAGRRSSRALAGALAAGAALGAATWLVPGLAVYGGALVLLGMVAGLVAWLVAVALGPRRRGVEAAVPGAAEPGDGDASVGTDLAAVALLAVGAAAVTEAAFGIQTVGTEVVFWGLAGIVAAMSTRVASPEVARRPAEAYRPEPSRRDARRSAEARPQAPAEPGSITISWSAGGALIGLVAGAQIAVVLFAFLVWGAPRLPAALPVALGLAALCWVAGMLVAVDRGESPAAAGITALAGGAGNALVRAAVLAATADPAALYAVTVLGLLGLALLGGWIGRARVQRAPIAAGATAIVYPVLAVAAVVLVQLLAVRPVQADIYFQQAAGGLAAALRGDDTALFRSATALFQRATTLAPREDVYHLEWGEMLMAAGASAADAQSAAPLFQAAQAEVAAAEALDPRMPYHTFNRGHLQLVFAEKLPAEQRASVAADAETALRQAFDRLPYDPQVARELALARLLRGDPESVASAVALLEYVRDQLDPDDPTTWQLLGRAYAAAGRADEAAGAIQQAVDRGVATPEDYVAMGDLARKSEDVAGAIGWYERAVAAGPVAWPVWFNLGLLYRDSGRTDEAMNALAEARKAAPPEEAERIEGAIQAVLGSRTGAPTP